MCVSSISSVSTDLLNKSSTLTVCMCMCVRGANSNFFPLRWKIFSPRLRVSRASGDILDDRVCRARLIALIFLNLIIEYVTQSYITDNT